MKYRFASAAVLFSVLSAGCQQQGGVDLTAQAMTRPAPATDRGAAFFYDRLARLGQWIDTAEYGLCWYPAEVSPSWRPYTNGRWVYTIGSGWLWVGGEKWGWATDHYGQWVFLDSHGWVWVPGKQWSPAWVVWRAGNGYVGWAPMPPTKVDQPDLDVTRADSKKLPPLAFTFVPEKFIAAEKLADHVEPITRNITLLEMTEDATRYQMSDGRIFNGGVSVATIDNAAGEPVRQFHVVESINLRVPEIRGEDVQVYRPNLDNAAEAILAGMTSGPPQPPPRPRDPRPELLAAQRERLVDYHQQLRRQMQERQERERTAPAAATQPDIAERQEHERLAFEDQRQREVEALRRRQLDECERFAARQPPPPTSIEQSDQQATQAKHYEIPPEWQLPPQMMPPPKPSPRR